MEKDTKIIDLGKYIIKKGIRSPLKFQKLLFFIRYEEKKNNVNSGYFEENGNFEAWVYGPVNRETYEFFKLFFWGEDELEGNSNLEDDKFLEMENKFSDYFEKWNKLDAHSLVEKSHLNRAWIKAREGKEFEEPSTKTLDEESVDFIEFNKEVED